MQLRLTDLLERTYQAPVVVHAFWIASNNPGKLVLEIDCTILGEQRSKAFVEVTK